MLGFVKIVPNLEALNLKDFAAHAETVSSGEVVSRLVYAAAYAGLSVALASAAFLRRDLR